MDHKVNKLNWVARTIIQKISKTRKKISWRTIVCNFYSPYKAETRWHRLKWMRGPLRGSKLLFPTFQSHISHLSSICSLLSRSSSSSKYTMCPWVPTLLLTPRPLRHIPYTMSKGDMTDGQRAVIIKKLEYWSCNNCAGNGKVYNVLLAIT